jgi:hypothetical protein
VFQTSTEMLKKKTGGVEGKKKTPSGPLTCFAMPHFSQIFSVFGNKDSCILNENC